MSREIKYYTPEERRFVLDNLQCHRCGNTNAFCIDLRLGHTIEVLPTGELSIELDQRAEQIFNILSRRIWSIVEKGNYNDNPLISCANCGDGYVDMQERLLDWCNNMGCPGCDVCGNYIDEEELRNLCLPCISEHNGDITEEDCSYHCPYYEDGLGNVRAHYSITMNELKREVGYPS